MGFRLFFPILLASSLLGSVALAKSFVIETVLKPSSEFDEIDDKDAERDGWVVSKSENEKSYYLTVTIPESKLPFKKRLGSSFVSISKNGLVQMGISIGDADAGTEASLQWPYDAKSPAELPAPLTFTVSGGDYASGTWSLEGQTTVKVVP